MSYKSIQDENRQLRIALEAYANPNNWIYYDGWHPTNELHNSDGSPTYSGPIPAEDDSETGPWVYARSALDKLNEK